LMKSIINMPHVQSGPTKTRFSNSRVCLTRGKTMAPALYFVDLFLLGPKKPLIYFDA
jgi:hypothetical protein